LLDSQFATLEEPTPDEHPIVVSIAPHPREIVDAIVNKLNIGATKAADQRTAPAR
jgi:gluconokinase